MTNWSVTDGLAENGYQRLKQKIQREGGQCAKCPSVQNITVDHIIPQQFLTMLGFYDAYKEGENLQLLCKKCNTTKGNILDYTNPKTLPLLKYYVNRWIQKHGKLYIKMTTRKLTARCLCNEHIHLEVPVWRKSTFVPAKPSPLPKPDVIRKKEDVDDYNW